jgi:hypothetical protein
MCFLPRPLPTRRHAGGLKKLADTKVRPRGSNVKAQIGPNQQLAWTARHRRSSVAHNIGFRYSFAALMLQLH